MKGGGFTDGVDVAVLVELGTCIVGNVDIVHGRHCGDSAGSGDVRKCDSTAYTASIHRNTCTRAIIQQCARCGCTWFPRAHADVDILPVFC